MNSKILSIRNKLKDLLKNKEILDIVLFGSSIKGKILPKDIDIAIITKNPEKIKSIEGFHISVLKPDDFFINPPTIINTLMREGYSLKNNKSFSEIYRFSNKILFIYGLKSLKASTKVRVVNILRGKGKEKGFVTENKGEWLANQVFIIPTEKEYIFEKFFLNFKIKYRKFYVLMH